MRLGKVRFVCEYVVDLDDDNMVFQAEDCIVEDVCNAIKYREVCEWLDIAEDKTLTANDIPEFLREKENEI